jgi:hypothetical protein
MTEMVFWLFVVFNGNGRAVEVVPVPYTSFEQCAVAAAEIDKLSPLGVDQLCVQQPKQDVIAWQGDNAP